MVGGKGYAQLTPQFQTVIRFEDAIGLKDSIVVGLDSLATAGLDPLFGETNITTPFNSFFEVRSEISGVSYYYSKKNISRKFCPTYYGSVTHRVMLHIKCRNWPLKVSWDSTAFKNNANVCVSKSFMDYGDLSLTLYPIYPNMWQPIAYLANRNHIMIPILNSFGSDSLSTLTFMLDNIIQYEPGSVAVPVSVAQSSLKLYPNPSEAVVYWQGLQEEARVSVYNSAGALVTSQKVLPETGLAIKDLPQGLYHYRLSFADTRRREVSGKFVKE